MVNQPAWLTASLVHLPKWSSSLHGWPVYIVDQPAWWLTSLHGWPLKPACKHHAYWSGCSVVTSMHGFNQRSLISLQYLSFYFYLFRFAFFRIMSILFRSQKSLFRFELKQAKLALSSAPKRNVFRFFFALFRFEAKRLAYVACTHLTPAREKYGQRTVSDASLYLVRL